jgi:hypothetical protein
MSAHNNKKSLKKFLMLMGVASTSTFLALPALANINASSRGQLLAQIDPGNTQQNSAGTGTTPETFGNPIPPPQIPPIGTGTIPQTFGNPIPQLQIPPIGTFGNPIPQPQIPPIGAGTILQSPTGTDTIQQFPGGTGTTQPDTQINGM